MPREANLFESVSGSVVEAFLLLRLDGKNVPPAWIERAHESRKNREKRLAELLTENSLDALQALRDWSCPTVRSTFTMVYGRCWKCSEAARPNCEGISPNKRLKPSPCSRWATVLRAGRVHSHTGTR